MTTTDEDMVQLVAPTGTDEANVGEVRYSVRDDGTITVPHDVALKLEHNPAGFVEANPPGPPVLCGTLKLRGGPGASATWGGATYSVDASGVVTIPAAAWPDLSSHGFRIAAG